MLVTINTDASYHPHEKVAGFAFWIVCDDFKLVKSGELRKKCHRPEVAEFRCIINAVHLLFQQDCKKISKIILNTDCLNVIHLLKRDGVAIRRYKLNGDWSSNMVKMFYGIVGQTPIEFRHVKAHVSTDTARSWVNDWCDSNAKQAMRSRLSKHLKS